MSPWTTEPVPVEQRLLRCDVCGRTFVLSYRRLDPQPLSGNVVRSEYAKCPRPECGSKQPVLVPMDAHGVATFEWFGASELPSSNHTLGEVLRGSVIRVKRDVASRSGGSSVATGGQVLKWWRLFVKRVRRLRPRDA
jgi:hypothetical protein